MSDEVNDTPAHADAAQSVRALIDARSAVDEAIGLALAALPEDERAELLGDEVSGFGLPVIKDPIGGISGGLLGTATPQFGRLGSRTGLSSQDVQNTKCNSGCPPGAAALGSSLAI